MLRPSLSIITFFVFVPVLICGCTSEKVIITEPTPPVAAAAEENVATIQETEVSVIRS